MPEMKLNFQRSMREIENEIVLDNLLLEKHPTPKSEAV